jgi:hypothetical protein
MTAGALLTSQQIQAAIQHNSKHSAAFVAQVVTILRMPAGLGLDEVFVRLVADWQELTLGAGQGDGKIGPKTEAYLAIPHPRALDAVARARAVQRSTGILFDSWGNDLRDNDGDGVVDGKSEKGLSDGAHFGRVFTKFRVVAGTYTGQGWGGGSTVVVPSTKDVSGSFQYKVCADVVSGVYAEAGVMSKTRSTAQLLQNFRNLGYVWHRSESWPPTYVPGDFICTLEHGSGHSGIVVDASPTTMVPRVVELPGPSTQADEGTYDPGRPHDVRLGLWTKRSNPASQHYLGRLLLSKLRK